MRPLRHPLASGAGHRTPQTMLLLDERDRYLREAARFFPYPSDREVARQLRRALLTYRGGAWRREYSEALCPERHRGKLKQALWCLLKSRDAIPCDRSIRTALAQSRIQTRFELCRPAIRCPRFGV
jgi:hypothetical protein